MVLELYTPVTGSGDHVHSDHLVVVQVALPGIRSCNLLAGNPWVLGFSLANGTTWASRPYLLEGGNTKLFCPSRFAAPTGSNKKLPQLW